jgi:heterotetrameric sarcosine oxidase delta subunit
MQQFTCPWCGNRSESEFRYAGDAGIDRPERTVDDKAWAQYLHFRRNAKGAALENWIHSAGCGRWIVLSRDTVTHVVTGSEPMV